MCLNIHLDHDGRVRRHGITITTSYPPINGASDFVYKVLNTDFTPNNLKPKSNVTVLWTNTTTDPSKPITRTWTPNHFVLLATAQAIPPPSPTAQAIPPPSPTAQAIPPPAQATPPPSPTAQATPPPSPTAQVILPPSPTAQAIPSPSPTAQAIPPPSPTAQAIPPPSPTAQAIPPPSPPAQAIPPPSPTAQAIPPPAQAIPPPSPTAQAIPPPAQATPPPSPTAQAILPPSPTAQATPPPSPTAQATPPPSPTAQAIPPPSPTAQATPPPSSEPEPDVNDISDQPEEISSDQTVNIDDTNDDDMMQSVDCNTDNDVYQTDNDGPKMHPLPNNVLNASELYSIVTSDKPTFTSIPMGQKNNCYMLLDNSTNVEHKKPNKKSQFSDDLGSWNSDSGTTVNTHYVINHDFKCAYMKKWSVLLSKESQQQADFYSNISTACRI